MKPLLSIVVPTCNRASLLAACLNSLEELAVESEIIVVDGASFDTTRDVIGEAECRMGKRLKVIRETRREGFVRAVNKGFQMARGENLMWLNDDARPLPGALEIACEQLDQQPSNVGLLALFHRFHSTWNCAYEQKHAGRTYRLCHVRGTLYANFALGRRETFERLNYFDERYYVCAADPDLSLKAWYAGMTVVPAWGCFIDHDEFDDDRRLEDSERGKKDNDSLFAKWDLPMRGSPAAAWDADRPCSMGSLKSQLSIAA